VIRLVDYGWGFKVKDSGEVEITPRGKIVIADDRENFGQQLSLRLRSPRGSHPFDPSFGLDMIGVARHKKFYKDMRDGIKYSIIECLTKHPYVKKIDFVVVDHYADRAWNTRVRVLSVDNKEVFFDTIIEENADIRTVIDDVLG